MAARFSKSNSSISAPAGKLVKVTSGVTFPLCRSLQVGTAGTATLIDAEGNTATNYPLTAGLNPIRVSRVTFGSANDVWALY